MQITLDGSPRTLIPIRAFRAAYNLPESFGVAYFEPKDYTGLGSIDSAGLYLNMLRAAVLEATPAAVPPAQWLAALHAVIRAFDVTLNTINPHIGLREAEIGFAVSGFSDALHAYTYATLRSGPALPFMAVYGAWIDGSVTVSQTAYAYPHRGAVWRVWVINDVYGRLGLIVEFADSERHYVLDSSYACPAEGFMSALIRECAAKLQGG